MGEKREKMKRPVRVADLLSGLFRGQPLEKRLREGRIWEVWKQAVGAQIAEKAQPAKFRDGTLTVNVASAPWMQQLTFLRQEMIRKLNGLLGEELVKEIYLKAGKAAAASPPRKEPARPPRRLSPEEVSWVEEVSGTLDDPQLGQAIRDLLTQHLRKPPQ